MLKEIVLIFIIISQLIGNIRNIELNQQQIDDLDYENETAMRIDESMVNLRKSTLETDAELIMMSRVRNENIKRRKRQADTNDDQNPSDDNNPGDSSQPQDNFTPDDDSSIDSDVITSIHATTTSNSIDNFPLSVITRPPTTTVRATTTTLKGRTTYFTKKPMIFPSETTKTTITQSTRVGNLARYQNQITNAQALTTKKVAVTMEGRNGLSTTKRSTTSSFQKKGTVKFPHGTTKRLVGNVTTTMKNGKNLG